MIFPAVVVVNAPVGIRVIVPPVVAIPAGGVIVAMAAEPGVTEITLFDHVPVNDSGMFVSLDAKKYFVSTDAHWYVNGAEVINTKHKLDPWVLSAGVGFRF